MLISRLKGAIMGKIRIKKIGFEKPEKKKKEKVKKKTAKVPGLKGGERVKVVEGVIIEESITEAPKEPEALEKGTAETPRKVLDELGPRGKRKEEETRKKGSTEALKETEVLKKRVRKPKVRSKNYQKVAKLVDKTKLYLLDEALELVKKTSISNFEGAVEAHVNLLPKSMGGKFTLSFPHETKKKTIILAFGKDAKKAGADIAGDEKIIKKIAEGFKDFSVVLATPEWMTKLAKVAKFLGPKGLMPNPKTGTVTKDLKETIKKFKSGKTILSTEKKALVIHAILGKVNWPKKDLKENLEVLVSTIGEAKIKKLTLCATMGPGIKVALNTP